MYPIERKKAIVKILEERGAMSVREFSKELYIGEATIRRDLEELGESGLVIRTHGGAVSLSTQNAEQPLKMRETENIELKERIAACASELIGCGKTVFLDSSSTVLRVVPYLQRKQLTVITNGVRTALELSRFGIKTFCTGGALAGTSAMLVGTEAVKSVEKYHADIFLFSCRGINKLGELTENTEEAVSVKEVMERNSEKTMLLIDSSKLNKTAFKKLEFSRPPEYLISDFSFSDEWKVAVAGTKVLVAD